MKELRLSPLRKTWFVDLDGTILRHNGYLNGADELLPGAFEFMKKAYETGRVVIITGREERFKEETLSFLERSGIRFNDILFGMPLGERVIVNDSKPSGLKTAFAINIERDRGIEFNIVIDESL